MAKSSSSTDVSKKVEQSKPKDLNPKMKLGVESMADCKLFWQILSGVFALLFIVTLIVSLSYSNDEGVKDLNFAKNEVTDLLKKVSELSESPFDVNITSAREVSGLYEFTVSASGQDVKIYTTRDVNLFIGLSSAPVTKQEILNQLEFMRQQQKSQEDAQKLDELRIINIPQGDDPYIGSENAPVTIVEFSDFECPFCSRFHNETYKQIYENYIKTGKVKLVYKDYPLSFHPNAKNAALAANCAIDQNKYWEMHDVIFNNNTKLSESDLKSYAKNLGLDESKFNECYDSKKYFAEIEADMAELETNAGVQGTPYFLVNGRQIKGAYPYSYFENMINEELAKNTN